MAESTVLNDIGLCKQKLLTAFVNSNEICELLFNKKQYTEEDVENLIYTQVFPYLYTDETQTETLTYLCFEIDVQSSSNNKTMSGTIKNLKMIIFAYCHKDIMDYHKEGYYGTRVDILANMAERQLRDSYDFGIGKPELVSVTNLFPNNNYYGRQLVYNVPEFKIKGRV